MVRPLSEAGEVTLSRSVAHSSRLLAGLGVLASMAAPSTGQYKTAPGIFVDEAPDTPGRVMFLPGSAGWRAEAPTKLAHRKAAAATVKALVKSPGRIPKDVKIVVMNLSLGTGVKLTAAEAHGTLSACSLWPVEDLTPHDVAREYFLVRAQCPTAIAGSPMVYIAVGEDDGVIRTVVLTEGGTVGVILADPTTFKPPVQSQ